MKDIPIVHVSEIEGFTRRERDEVLRTHPEVVYHYTSTDVITNILTKDGIILRFSDIRCVNDFSESTDASDMYQNVCRDLNERQAISSRFFEMIKNVEGSSPCILYVENTIDENGKEVKTLVEETMQVRYFICCFSKNSDSLPMWNYYSKNSHYEGYSIGFKSNELSQYIEELNLGEDTYFMNLIYDNTLKYQMIKNVVLDAYGLWTKGENNSAISKIRDEFIKWQILFKNSSFNHEEEVRLVLVSLQHECEFVIDPRKRQYVKIGYKTSHGLLVPYIDLNISKVIFDSITVGPFSNSAIDKANQKDIILSYLAQNGYTYSKDSTVFFSNAPVRF